MNKTSISLDTSDGRRITLSHWPAASPIANIHIMHGMAEHIDRYEAFAQHLVSCGFSVWGHNHRGHGEGEIPGHYADHDGWEKIISDISLIHDHIKKDASTDLPLVLFGHSMGSFIAQSYSIRHGKRLSALVLSGSNYQHPFMYYAGRIVAGIERKRLDLQTPSTLMDALSFGSFNGHFKPARTDFDWLTRDPAEVDKYIADSMCGFPCTGETWCRLFDGLIEISNVDNLQKIPSDLPILIFGGDKDPVGRMGKGLKALEKKLIASDHSKVELKIYQDGRHEMLNETCRDDVHQHVSQWIQKSLSH